MRIRYRDDDILTDGGHGYSATNEAPEALTKLIDKIDPAFKVENVGSICSGGEIPILVLAPRYPNVIAVDNSRGSLMWAILKAQMLRNLDPADVQKIFSAPLDLTNADLQKIARRLVRRGLALSGYQGPSTRNITDIWSKVMPAELTVAAQSLGNIQFVHGDMALTWEKEAALVGGLDLIYTSNAMTFGAPANKGAFWPVKKFADILKPGGYVLSTSDPNYGTAGHNGGVNNPYGIAMSTIPAEFDIIAAGTASRTVYTDGMNWQYWLGRKPLDGKPPTQLKATQTI